MDNNLIRYYDKRAKEYENIYAKPERQKDILGSVSLMQELLAGKEVFEVACGTGFWTQFIARSARSVLATDVNQAVIDIAKQKAITNPDVAFQLADLYTYTPAKKFQSVFGGFIWSHVLKKDLPAFYRTLNSFSAKDGSVVLMDNLFVEGSNHPVTRSDADDNTYQTRKLSDGATYEVLKNFATEAHLKESLEGYATDLNFMALDYFWILTYKPANT